MKMKRKREIGKRGGRMEAIRWLNAKLGLRGVTRQRQRQIEIERDRERER